MLSQRVREEFSGNQSKMNKIIIKDHRFLIDNSRKMPDYIRSLAGFLCTIIEIIVDSYLQINNNLIFTQK